MREVMDIPQMYQCGECGAIHYDLHDHKCPEPKDLPAKDRRPSNYGNFVHANLSRGDKEQLDRIEKMLGKLLDAAGIQIL